MSQMKNIIAYQRARQLFEEVNQIAAETELSEMTMDDIINEIKDCRKENRLQVVDSEAWTKLAAEQFLQGYAEEDSVYDKF